MIEVLIVDDDPDARTILNALVKLLNRQADSAENGTQALTLLRSPTAAYRLILSDLALPGNMDGLEFIRWVRADPRFYAIPCIAITAFDSPHLRTQALQAGFTAYYVKPIDPPAILRDLKEYLALP